LIAIAIEREQVQHHARHDEKDEYYNPLYVENGFFQFDYRPLHWGETFIKSQGLYPTNNELSSDPTLLNLNNAITSQPNQDVPLFFTLSLHLGLLISTC